jgi:hypothetical protein
MLITSGSFYEKEGAEETLGKTSLGFSLFILCFDPVVCLLESSAIFSNAVLDTGGGTIVWMSKHAPASVRLYFTEVGGLGRPDIRNVH